MEKHRRTPLQIATVAVGLAVVSACGDGPAEPPPPPPILTYSLVIERSPGEILEGDCATQEDWADLPLNATFTEEGASLKVNSNLGGASPPIAWEGAIDAAGNFQINASAWGSQPATWEVFKAAGSISADRTSLTATEEFRHPGTEDSSLCHRMSEWSR